MRKFYFLLILVIFIFLGKTFLGTTEKEMNILELDQDEKTGLVYIKDSKKIFTGVGKTYYESGKIRTEKKFIDGKLDGSSKGYYENGKKTSVSNYKNGKLEGEKLSYYKNGSLYIEANYSNDELDGDIKVYKKNGDLDYIAPCELLTTNTLRVLESRAS